MIFHQCIQVDAVRRARALLYEVGNTVVSKASTWRMQTLESMFFSDVHVNTNFRRMYRAIHPRP